MATVLTVGDIAIVQYNSGTTDTFTFVFLRDVDAGTTVNFTDNGWLAAGGFRPGEGTVTYTAPSAITAGTTVTLSGLNLDDAGDQIIAYQGDPATPTILHVVDLADGNNTVAGDATNDNTTALPPGFTLDVNAVAVGFDNAIYAGPTSGSPPELFPLINDGQLDRRNDSLRRCITQLPAGHRSRRQQFDVFGDDYGPTSPRAGRRSRFRYRHRHRRPRRFYDLRAQIDIQGTDFGDLLSVNGSLPLRDFRLGFRFLQRHPHAVRGGVAFRLSDRDRADQVQHDPAGRHPQDDRSQRIRRVRMELRGVRVPHGIERRRPLRCSISTPTIPTAAERTIPRHPPPAAGHSDRRHRRFHHRRRQHDDRVGDDQDRDQPAAGRPALDRRNAADRHHGFELQFEHRRPHAQRRGVARRLSDRAAPGGLQHTSTRRRSPATASSRSRSTTAPSTAISRRCTCTSCPRSPVKPCAGRRAPPRIPPCRSPASRGGRRRRAHHTLSVSSGTLNVIAGAGVSGNGSASVTITGTAAQINVALAGLSYAGNLDFNGAGTLTVATTDGTDTDTDTIAITVNPVNDAPVNTVPGAQSVAEDTALPIAGVSVADVDSGTLTTTLKVSSGTINVTAGAGVSGNGTAASPSPAQPRRSTRRCWASAIPATSTSTAPTRSGSRPATGPPSTPTRSRSPSMQ